MKTASEVETLERIAIQPGIESFDFQLPPGLEASMPPEARGLARDQVRLMVSYVNSGRIVHTQFRSLPDFLEPGDLLVINTSGTLKASLPARSQNGTPLELHISTHLPDGSFSIELRRPSPEGSQPYYDASPDEILSLPARGSARLVAPYLGNQRQRPYPQNGKIRLWIAALQLPEPFDDYLEAYGSPIRYKYVPDGWPISLYQNVYTTENGSAEMASAGRAFTPKLITRLVSHNVHFSPLILHAGVASLENHEPPYEEYFCVPVETARAVNSARVSGCRVIAVGTTSVRALESVSGFDGRVSAAEDWTDRIITPQDGLRVVDGLLTGLHEPRSTHLALLEALAGAHHIRQTYRAAIEQGYLWHEFGDLHLILP